MWNSTKSLPKPLRRRGCIPPKYSFLSKRASLSCEKGVSSLWREPFFTPTKRPLYLQTIVITPLSIRRGVGGEAFLYLQTIVFTPLSIRRGVGGEAFLHLQTMVFTPLSIRRGVGGEAVVGLVVSLYWSGVRLFLSILKYSFYMIETQFYVYLCSLN